MKNTGSEIIKWQFIESIQCADIFSMLSLIIQQPYKWVLWSFRKHHHAKQSDHYHTTTDCQRQDWNLDASMSQASVLGEGV